MGKPERRLENNVRIDLKEMGVNTRNGIGSAQSKVYCELH